MPNASAKADPAEPATASAETAVLERLNRAYVAAVEAADVTWFEENLAPDFMNSNPDGSLVDRAGFLAQIARGSAISNIEAHDVLVRRLDDVAFVHARTTYILADGGAGMGRYTDVWRYRDGCWRCVCAQVTRC